ncbi:hypothetical protein [Shewanella sp. OMA3-2]|uniref:hypothetical protein n=1 Tax=Shewanella sp. OMA3-2 TaxID=2908650 RepID=UPI001F470494|nr:hypothetical protein [Shewanella sp. OMA3-2]UJF22662.1 hypothetical protein L0B17_04490 [Shewanella sp. OMA3-2]
MMRLLFATVLVTTSFGFEAVAADVGVSINIGQPGFYGRIDLGNVSPPQLIYAEPMMIESVIISRPVVYLRVPDKHAKKWDKHCHRYNACGERVLFVQDNWYNNEYVPYYHDKHDKHDKKHNKKHKKDKEHKGHKD